MKNVKKKTLVVVSDFSPTTGALALDWCTSVACATLVSASSLRVTFWSWNETRRPFGIGENSNSQFMKKWEEKEEPWMVNNMMPNTRIKLKNMFFHTMPTDPTVHRSSFGVLFGTHLSQVLLRTAQGALSLSLDSFGVSCERLGCSSDITKIWKMTH